MERTKKGCVTSFNTFTFYSVLQLVVNINYSLIVGFNVLMTLFMDYLSVWGHSVGEIADDLTSYFKIIEFFTNLKYKRP